MMDAYPVSWVARYVKELLESDLRLALARELGELRRLSGDELVAQRHERFRRIGVFDEVA